MKLRTEIKISSAVAKIDHSQKIYFTGSCFSESIASKFGYFGFDVLSNSHGIVYNPFSISESFFDLMNPGSYTEKELSNHDGKYFSYAHHGSFASKDPKGLVDNMNGTIQRHANFLKTAKFIFITLGTAWVYVEKEKGTIVANCHKMPEQLFHKRLLTSAEIDHHIEQMIDRILFMNPEAHIVFTLSPVKHLKDGFVENQLSKSLLHTCIHNWVTGNVTYFPAYEIMNDDLRDYRFWKEDMVHPNEMAIDYIWEKFSETYFTKETMGLMEEVKNVRQFCSHRSLSNDVNEVEKLKTEQERKLGDLKTKYPQLIL